MEQERSPNWVLVVILLVIALGLGACSRAPTSSGLRPECPQSGDWSEYFDSVSVSSTGEHRPSKTAIAKKPGTMPGELSGSKMITNIPEFHDCQQFVVQDASGRQSFTSLFAIFARIRLDTVAVESTTPFPGARALKGDVREQRAQIVAGGRGRAGRGGAGRGAIDPLWVSEHAGISVAEIYSYDREYEQLGIKPNFNCVYIYPKSGTPDGLEARIVPVDVSEGLCTELKMPNLPSKVLVVTRHLMSGGSAQDYPPVARWDWDSKHSTHYIGIRCGDAWCEVGPSYGAAPFVSSAPQIAAPGATQAQRRVTEVKGWYDEQRLALPATTSPLKVSSLIGTIKPDPDLGSLDGTPARSFKSTWQPVASVSIRVAGVSDGAPALYKSKLNLELSNDPTVTNQVSMCFDSTASRQAPNACVPDSAAASAPKCTNVLFTGWWSKIESATSHTTKYYCVIRRGHEDVTMPGFSIPGIVRWRWAIKDETIWARCLEGCCEVET